MGGVAQKWAKKLLRKFKNKKLHMKYIYYYLWLSLAFLHKNVSKMVLPLNWLIIRLGNKSEKDQKEWHKNFNEAFLKFPGGLLDWGAYGLLVAIVFAPIALISWVLVLPVFSSKLNFWGIYIGIAVFVYFWIYHKSLSWLKKKIVLVNKKYTFK